MPSIFAKGFDYLGNYVTCLTYGSLSWSVFHILTGCYLHAGLLYDSHVTVNSTDISRQGVF